MPDSVPIYTVKEVVEQLDGKVERLDAKVDRLDDRLVAMDLKLVSPATVQDHEVRIRALERWRWGLPASLVTAVGGWATALFAIFADRH